jgi:hypothetical protein
MYADDCESERLTDPCVTNFSAWGKLSSMESLTDSSGGWSKYVDFFAHTVGDCLTRCIKVDVLTPKLRFWDSAMPVHQLEWMVANFSLCCTGTQPEKRSSVSLRIHMMCVVRPHQPTILSAFPYLECDTQLALRILLTEPARAVVDPRIMKRGFTFSTS